MPLIHRNIEILRDKLAKSDLQCVNKRIGINRTLMFAIDPLKYDPDIPILGQLQLADWLACINSHGDSRLQKPKFKTVPRKTSQDQYPEQPELLSTKSKTVPRKTSQDQYLELSDSLPKKFKTVPRRTSQDQHPEQPELSPAKSKTIPRKTSQDQYLEQPELTSTKSKTLPRRTSQDKDPEQPELLSTKFKTVLRRTSQDQYPEQPELPSAKSKTVSRKTSQDHNLEQPELLSTNSSQDSTSAIWECEVDALIINEKIDDEFANLSDEEDETEIAKNRKKIRVEVPAKPDSNPPPKQPNNIFEKSHSKPQANGTENLPTELLAPSIAQPQPVLEPNWAQTARQLLNNQFNLVFKDLFHFKDKVKKDHTAKQLLKDTVIKCIQEDETSQLIDFLTLVYEVQITDDPEFWSELVLRLKRKLNSHSTLKCFKSKANPEWIFNNYINAIASIGRHAREIDLTIKLPFNTMIWLIDLSKPPQPTPVASDADKVIKQEGPSLADAKFNVKFLKLKTEIKDEPETHEQQTTVVNGPTENTAPIVNPTVNNNTINPVIPPQRRDEQLVKTFPVSSENTNPSSKIGVTPITTAASKTPLQGDSRKVVAETNDKGRMSFTITAKRRPRRTKQ